MKERAVIASVTVLSHIHKELKPYKENIDTWYSQGKINWGVCDIEKYTIKTLGINGDDINQSLLSSASSRPSIANNKQHIKDMSYWLERADINMTVKHLMTGMNVNYLGFSGESDQYQVLEASIAEVLGKANNFPAIGIHNPGGHWLVYATAQDQPQNRFEVLFNDSLGLSIEQHQVLKQALITNLGNNIDYIDHIAIEAEQTDTYSYGIFALKNSYTMVSFLNNKNQDIALEAFNKIAFTQQYEIADLRDEYQNIYIAEEQVLERQENIR